MAGVDVITFARGNPTPDILPVEEFAECAEAVIAREGRTILNYGPPSGYGPLREWIAEYHGADPSQVVISTGSLASFNFVARHLYGSPGRAVVEAPSYDRTIGVLRSLGAVIEPVPLTDDGLDLDRLEAILAAGEPPKLVYTIPTFQNPTGRTLSLDQRHALVELCQARGVLLFEDDPYRLVRYEGEPQPSMHELAGGQGVVFSSSFSKTGAPGLRVGYVILPPAMVKPVEAIAASTYIGPPLLNQAMLHEFIARGLFESNLARVCAELKSRRDTMLEALADELPESASWSRPEGGYFLWLDLPAGVGVEPLFDRAAEAGVHFVKGTDFYAGDGGEESARLAFSFSSLEEIREGVRRLGALVRDTVALPA
jgi:DNA-binding transcriptional MocR family regulator